MTNLRYAISPETVRGIKRFMDDSWRTEREIALSRSAVRGDANDPAEIDRWHDDGGR